VFGDSLDDQLPVGELAEVGDEAQPAQRGIALGFGQFAVAQATSGSPAGSWPRLTT
jgi:hypothetical protein